jgi:hypothetical protein
METIWSAVELGDGNWPPDARWAKPAFEADIQHHWLVIVGCGSPVVGINRSIETARALCGGLQQSYLVSCESFADYSGGRNPELVECAAITADRFCEISGSEFLQELHELVCEKILGHYGQELLGDVRDRTPHSVPGAVYVEEQERVQRLFNQTIQELRGNLNLTQRFLKRSILWGGDVASDGIRDRYIPLRPNKEIVNDLIDAVSALRVALDGAEFDNEQVYRSLILPNARPLLLIHCQKSLPIKIWKKLLEMLGPDAPQELTLLFLRTDARTEDISNFPPIDRTNAAAGPSRNAVSKEPPRGWKFASSVDTIDRGPYEQCAQWKAIVQERVT